MAFRTITFRTKVTLLISGVILLLGMIAVTQARQNIRNILGNELEQRGQAIARDLAANSADLLLTGDLVGLYDLVNRAKINNSDVRYILIVNPAGEARINTFGDAVPRGLLAANAVPDGERARLRRIQTEEGLIRDVAVPVLEGRAGVVRVGMSNRSVESAVARNIRELTALVAVAVAVGFVVSYCLGYFLTRPLTQLLSAVRLVARGDFSQRIPSPGRDEVGQLGRAFNLMARELEAKEAAQHRLMEKVISSQEEERKRVARELHDELAQRLTSSLLSLGAAESALAGANGNARETIRRAKSATESSLAATRKLIGDLRPTVLDDLGLAAAIRSYAESHLAPLDTSVVIRPRGLNGMLSGVVETAVYRIVQEAVNNIGKHARATSARVALRIQDGALQGEVADDGRGFQPLALRADGADVGAGWGIQGMEERATLLGGTLRVSSRPGKGTRVSFTIPLKGGGDGE